MGVVGTALPSSTIQPSGRIPLHVGYVEQPQNWLPAFAPFLAVRLTMSEPQVGQMQTLSFHLMNLAWSLI